MSDSDEKNWKLRGAPTIFVFGFYNINVTNRVFLFMYVINTFCIFHLDRYCDVSFKWSNSIPKMPQGKLICLIKNYKVLYSTVTHTAE